MSFFDGLSKTSQIVLGVRQERHDFLETLFNGDVKIEIGLAGLASLFLLELTLQLPREIFAYS